MRRKRRRLEVLGPFSPLTYRCAAALEERTTPPSGARALARRELSEIVLRALQGNDYFRIPDHSGVSQFGGGLRQCFRQLKLSLQAGRHSGTSGRWRS